MKDPLPRSYKYALLCSMHHALCTLLYALCSMDYALLCSMQYALCCIQNALTLRRSQVSRRLDLLFAGGSKLHYCHSKDHKVASLETRGRYPRLSTGICPRKLSPLSLVFFATISSPSPVGGVSIRHYLLWCGWRTLKIHPLDHTLQIHKYKYTPPLVHYKFRAEGNLSHPAE